MFHSSIKQPPSSCNVLLSVCRLKKFKASLYNAFKSEHAQSLSLDKVRTMVQKEQADAKFTEDEIMAAIDVMQEANQVMLSDNIIFLI